MTRMARSRGVPLQLPAETRLTPGTDDQERATAHVPVLLLEPFVLLLEREPSC
jgi:hypothetical protein